MGKPITGNFTGTVLFIDIKNFLSISEILTPREVKIFVQKAIDPLSNCIIKNGGYICQIQGDAILAVFGLKKPNTAHARTAVQCALCIQRSLEEHNPIIIEDLCIPLTANIGICTGEMYSCHIKVADYKEFTVLGKTVNLASRYQELNKLYGTNILIDESVFTYIKRNIATRKLDKVNIDGCSEPAKLYEVLFVRKKRDLESIRKRYNYQKGLIAYLRHEWDKAIAYFQRVSEDNIYGKMLKKCRAIRFNSKALKKDADIK